MPLDEREGRASDEKLGKEAQAVRSLIEAFGSDDDEIIQSLIEGETDFVEAVSETLLSIDEDRAIVEGIAGRLAELGQRKARYEKRIEFKRAAIERALIIAECGPVETPCGTVSLKATAPSLQILDEAAIPAAFWKRGDPKLDKPALLRALKEDGAEPIPGVCLSNGGVTLQLRVK